VEGLRHEGGQPHATLGERVRTLRRSAGLTQTELAAGRFSKEYVSQIERGSTRPSRETLEWLAERLRTDPGYLERGISRRDEDAVERQLAEAEALLERHRYDEALAAFRGARTALAAGDAPALAYRAARGEAWAHIRNGDLVDAMDALGHAADLTVGASFTDAERAEVVFLVAVVRVSESKIDEAIVLLDEALALAQGSTDASDELRSDIHHWRARCHRWKRDWVAAEEDSERALELAEASDDRRRKADALFQASLVAQRQGRWARARRYAEQSRELFTSLGDHATAARLQNNIAGLEHLLGKPERALVLLDEAFATFVELDLMVDAGYVCSSRAAVYLDLGDAERAELQARQALVLLGEREDHLHEIGTARVALGRALADRGLLDEAERSIRAGEEAFERAHSLSHRSDAWLAEGDLERLRGRDAAAAALYRRAAVALLDGERASS
jgi:tetratricopeptide (TPR) repeat protein